MRKRITLREVAKAAGVHLSTVSRALEPGTRHRVSPELVERIVRASDELGYRRNVAAYSLKTRRSQIIGVVVPDITNPIFPPIIRGIEDVLAGRSYLAIIGNTDGDHRRERSLLDTLVERGVDGLILASVERSDDALERALSEGIPIVTVNRRVDLSSVASVVHDENEGIRRTLTHLASLGHRKVAMIAGPQIFSTGADRYAAFERHRAAMGLAADAGLVVFANAYSEPEGERCIEELIAGGADFTAIVCGNDQLAMGAIFALERRGLKCPADLSITGYNDMPMVDCITPKLTTVRIRQHKMGQEAGLLLLDMIETPGAPRQHIVLPVELMVRDSTRPVTPG